MRGTWFLCGLLALFAGSVRAAPASPTTGVLGRLGGPPALAGAVPETQEKVIGRSARPAVALGSKAPLELRVPDGSRRLLFSAGGPTRGAPRPIRLSWEARVADAWQALGETKSLRRNRWADHVVDVPAEAEAVRFSVRFGSDTGVTDDQLWLGGVAFVGARPTEKSPPNVVLVSLDTLAAGALSSFGGPEGASPNLDRILSASRTYRRAFAPFGNTLISHGALFSGLHPDNSGILSRVIGIAPGRSLVNPLAAAGYLTLGVTENGFVGSAFGFARGYDRYDDGPPKDETSAERTFAEALRVFEQAEGLAPVFLFVHTYEVHSPYAARDDAEAETLLRTLSPSDTRRFEEIVSPDRGLHTQTMALPESDVDRLRALYLANVKHLDRLAGVFVRRLKELDPDGRTLIVLTSDHGEEFEPRNVGHGGLDNDVLHVPLAFHWPGHIEPGTVEEPVELVDVLPTTLELLGLEAPDGLDGQSLENRGLAAGEAFAVSRHHEAPQGCSSESCRKISHAVQSRRFKLVRRHDGSSVLYAIESDPDETTDVSDAHPAEVKRHLEWLDATLRVERETAASGPRELDARTEERLRALGYVD